MTQTTTLTAPKTDLITNSRSGPAIGRTYKSRIFEMVFSDKKELLALYNAVNGTHYTDPEELEINTLKNAIYMSMHNDLSFIIDSRLSLYEHQSTYSPNLPLRYLFYISDLYSALTRDSNLYGIRTVEIPPPRFLVFYNGVGERPEWEELKLSDAYNPTDREASLELTATLININPGYNEPLKNACKTLKDYSEYTARVRRYAENMPVAEAVEKAMDECIREGILAEFLSRNKAEAKSMSIYEYDEEKHMRQTREEGFEEGLEKGREEGLEKGREEGLEKGLEEGRKEGLEEGVSRINRLNTMLAAAGRMDDIIKGTQDFEYQKKLLKEFSL